MKIRFFVTTAVLVTAILCLGISAKAQTTGNSGTLSDCWSSPNVSCLTYWIGQMNQKLTQIQNQASITITSPNGGETLQAGEKYNIKWKETNLDNPTIKIVLTDASGNQTIIASTLNAPSKSYQWTIPITTVQGSQYKITVSALYNAASSSGGSSPATVTDTSDNYFSIITCTDSDLNSSYPDGKDYFTKGKVKWNGNTYEDFCMADGRVDEYYCEAGAEKHVPQVCEAGCSNGKCKEIKPTHFECKNQKCEKVNSAGESKCSVDSECQTVIPEGWCYDFKKGLSLYSSGEEVKSLQTALTKESVFTGNIDGFFDLNVYYAVKKFQKKYGISQVGTVGVITRGRLNLIYGCTKPSCVDSDNGKDYSVKGIVTRVYSNSSGIGTDKLEDACALQSGGNSLYEYYCDGNDAKTETKVCENGCSNGACKQATTTQPTNSNNVSVSGINITGANPATGATNTKLVESGKTLQMSATVSPSNATNQIVNWSVVGSTGSATINSTTGVLTGGTAGKVTVVATAQDGSGTEGSLVITVTPSISLTGVFSFDTFGNKNDKICYMGKECSVSFVYSGVNHGVVDIIVVPADNKTRNVTGGQVLDISKSNGTYQWTIPVMSSLDLPTGTYFAYLHWRIYTNPYQEAYSAYSEPFTISRNSVSQQDILDSMAASLANIVGQMKNFTTGR